MTRQSPALVIRKALAGDIPSIMGIEKELFPHPWKETMMVSELDHDISYFLVAEDHHQRRIKGYMIFWLMGDEIELHKIAASPNNKRRGIGKQLLERLLEVAGKNGVESVFLEVRASNREAIAFYEAYDFEKIALRKDYYNEPVEDAVIYKRIIKSRQ